MRLWKLLFGVLALGLITFVSGCKQSESTDTAPATAPDKAVAAPSSNPASAATQTSTPASDEVAVIKTSAGEMVLGFWPDVAPNTVENFKKLARQGFYDGTSFHRIIDGFMIQGGDPNTKDPAKKDQYGQGGPGYSIKGEVNNRPDRSHQRGVISMANSGSPDTAGSQFFICLAALPQLDGGYTTFGKLIKGDDVLTALGKSPCTGPNAMGEMSVPNPRVDVISIKIVPADSIK